MKTRALQPIAAALGLACAATGAHADSTTDDIKNATQLYLHYAHVTVGGFPGEAAVAPISKPAGTLTFDIPASALGFPLPGVTLHAVGTAAPNGKIVFTTGNSYKPAVTVDSSGETLSSTSGMFTMQTWSLAGAAAPKCGGQPCTGGTGFKVIGGTLIASGSFGTETIQLDVLHGVGGVARSGVGAVAAPPQHLGELPVCSGTTTTHALMRVELAKPAPIGGTRLDLTTTATGFKFPPSVLVPQGRDVVAIDVAVPANYAGTFALAAAAGGHTTSASLAIYAASACHAPARHYAIAPNAVASVAGCSSCSAFGALNNEGDRLIAIGGTVEYARGTTYMPLEKLWGVSDVGADSINDAGQIAGRMTINGVTQAYRADLAHGAHAPVLLGSMTPMAISQGGIVVGFRVDATTQLKVAVSNRGNGVVDVPLSTSYGVKSSRALFITSDGTIVGTYTGNDGVMRGYRYRAGVTTTLPSIGGNPAIPVGVTPAGSIAVNAGTTAAVVAPTNIAAQYGTPAGYTHFTVTGINRWGYVIGTALNANAVQRAFVYIPGTGFLALSGYLSSLTWADNALAINDDNQIAIHGLVAGASSADTYLLSL